MQFGWVSSELSWALVRADGIDFVHQQADRNHSGIFRTTNQTHPIVLICQRTDWFATGIVREYDQHASLVGV